MRPIFVSSGAFSSVRNLTDLLTVCREQGVGNVELASGLSADRESLERLRSESDAGSRFLLHNYFPAPEEPFVLNLADRDSENRNRSIEFCEDAMRLTAEIGAPFYSVHAGFVASLRPDDLGRPDRQNFRISEAAYAEAMERFTDSVSILDRFATESGVRLLLENNVDAVGQAERSHLLLVSGEDISTFFSEMTFQSVGLLMDVAHLAVSAFHRGFDREKALRDAEPWIEAFHLSDNDGQRDTNEMCRDDSWFWDPVVSSNCPVVLEAYRLNQEQVQDQVELFGAKLNETVSPSGV